MVLGKATFISWIWRKFSWKDSREGEKGRRKGVWSRSALARHSMYFLALRRVPPVVWYIPCLFSKIGEWSLKEERVFSPLKLQTMQFSIKLLLFLMPLWTSTEWMKSSTWQGRRQCYTWRRPLHWGGTTLQPIQLLVKLSVDRCYVTARTDFY